MRISTSTIVAAILTIFAAGCGGNTGDGHNGKDKLSIAVGVEPQRYILAQLLDSTEACITTVIAPGANPETYELTPKKRMALERADIYLSTGLLPFEEAITASLSTPVADTSRGITLAYGSHGECSGDHHGHHHDLGAPDPHVWTSVTNARIIAANMAEAIGTLRPDMRTSLQTHLKAFNLRLDSIDSDIRRRLGAPDATRNFAIWHPSLTYFARDYGLKQFAVGFESKEMPAGRLREIIADAADSDVKVFFFQREFDSRQAESLNNLLGTQMITIDPLSSDWERQLNTITDALAPHTHQ